MLRSHSAAIGSVSVSGSSFTLTGLEVEQCGWVEQELEPNGLAGS